MLWHYSPTCDVKIEGPDAVSVNHYDANLRIVPLGKINWQLKVVKGQEQPYIQGWYSETYGKKIPNPTVIYFTNIKESKTFAWLLIPAKNEVPKLESQYKEENGIVNISIKGNNKKVISITLPVEKDASKVDVRFIGN